MSSARYTSIPLFFLLCRLHSQASLPLKIELPVGSIVLSPNTSFKLDSLFRSDWLICPSLNEVLWLGGLRALNSKGQASSEGSGLSSSHGMGGEVEEGLLPKDVGGWERRGQISMKQK